MNYRLYNTVSGWLCFFIALIVYFLTLEPSVSFWDCGEFIAASYRLQVVHPPGAPLFLMLGRFFSLFAFGNESLVAACVNMLSAVASALTVLFTFWIITYFARKVVEKGKEQLLKFDVLTIMACGFTGALTLTFIDSFWFSAVEAEVYACSSFFTMLTFWVILKWEGSSHEPRSARWLILIAYLLGLSIGIHLLNLLVIPAVVYVYYFKKYRFNIWGFVVATLIAVAILLGIQNLIIPGAPALGAWFDRVFVNRFSMPFGSGLLIFIALLFLLLFTGVWLSHRLRKPGLNVFFLCLVFIFIGYSSYTMVAIRSHAQPPLDINGTSDPNQLVSYLNREQYGDRPLLYGPYYNAPLKDFKQGKTIWRKVGDKYKIIGRETEYIYDPSYMTWFPRMGDQSSSAAHGYRGWTGAPQDSVPLFSQNLEFFFVYQLNHMYWRYFLWNFAGRQNDEQGHGGAFEGNWISGIGPFDNVRLGPQTEMPDSMRTNKARNKYFLLPLVIGLLGITVQYNRNRNNFFIVLVLFLFTGLLIALYLNAPPYEPRERDYVFVGSFQVFCIWVGLGLLYILSALSRFLKGYKSLVLTFIFCLLASPVSLAVQNRDDHNRSNRKGALQYAKNYLEHLAPNAVLFTYGDNDTYPLWYAQAVEGVRPDVRVINMMLLNSEWYVGQLVRKAYDSEPLKLSIPIDLYMDESREIVLYDDGSEMGYSQDSVFNIKDLLGFIATDTLKNKVETRSGKWRCFMPAPYAFIPGHKQNFIDNNSVAPEDRVYLTDSIPVNVGQSSLFRAEIILLDILANNLDDRPVYFASYGEVENFPELNKYLRLEGLAYRLLPIQYPENPAVFSRMNSGQMNAVLKHFDFGGVNNPKVYIDPELLSTIAQYRNLYKITAEKLISEGRKNQAAELIDYCEQQAPTALIQHVFPQTIKGFIAIYLQCGQPQKAFALIDTYAADLLQKINYFASFNGTFYDAEANEELTKNIRNFDDVVTLLQNSGQWQKAAALEKAYKSLTE